jgi:hypothetical protein
MPMQHFSFLRSGSVIKESVDDCMNEVKNPAQVDRKTTYEFTVIISLSLRLTLAS